MDENGSPGEQGFPKNEGPRTGRFFWAIAGVVILYVLSCGPSYRLFVHGGADQYHWFQVYTPLTYAAHVCPPIRSFLNWYMELCNRREGENWYHSMW